MKPIILLLLLLTFTFASCSTVCKQNPCCPEPGHGDFCPICGVAIPPNEGK